jgi:hypothetical protein
MFDKVESYSYFILIGGAHAQHLFTTWWVLNCSTNKFRRKKKKIKKQGKYKIIKSKYKFQQLSRRNYQHIFHYIRNSIVFSFIQI